ncbi:hypothetical protein [Celeribacter marinus]|uniref:Uncharacterized protein n=1 Tax=Celeribacter marinus TaxID=1397108 RepID=A0A0P0A8G8_9RHOB|nr:hypothetical protein [Celeribacter marinus]ALI55952.1 hypothetical protein IMCC12053_2005 [Celeribacter marinus]ALI57097.1 hypothetical protein IMCC12053_3150 [Celeribacter marinus]SFL11419.1 hypothetical protein SAMN05444421_1322 [Celeribacter marinus]
MITVIRALLSGLGRRAVLYGAIALAVLAALWVAFRQGRQAAKAELAVRRADARVRSMQTSKDTRHDVQNTDRTDLERRADRWMRD